MYKGASNLFILLSLIASAFNADMSAQINESDTLKAQVRIVLNGFYQSGNVELLLIRSRLDGSLRIGQDWVVKTQNNFLYQEFYGTRADNDFASRNYLYFKTQNKIYPYLIAFVSGTYRRDINSRTFAGIGATWHVMRKSKHSIRFSANTVYEATWFAQSDFNIDQYNGNSVIDLWRCSFYTNGNHSFHDKSITISYEAFYQPSPQDFNNYRVHTDITVDFKIWKGLSINTSHLFTWESLVVESVKRKDTIVGFGLSYQWKKQS